MSPTTPDQVPHGFPFRLVERVEDPGQGRVAVVLASASDTLTGTSPWPITLLCEALAQSILLVTPPPSREELRLVALHRVRMHQTVGVGDRLEVSVEELGAYPPLRRYSCRAQRCGALVAEAEVTVSSGERES